MSEIKVNTQNIEGTNLAEETQSEEDEDNDHDESMRTLFYFMLKTLSKQTITIGS